MKLHEILNRQNALRGEARSLIDKAGDKLPDEAGQKRLDEIETELKDLDTRARNAAIIDAADRQAEGRTISGADADWERSLGEFSICRAMASTFEPGIDAGREREIGQELARRAGRPVKGLMVPYRALVSRELRRQLETRVLTKAGSGGNLVATDLRADEFIDALRPMSVTGRLGARTITGLVGDIALPKRTARTPAPAWFAENASITSGDQAFDQVSGAVKHLGAITEFSRSLLVQTTPAAEDLAREHMLAELAIGIDAGALKGAGAPAPTGITATSNINEIDNSGAAPTWANVVDAQAAVEGADVPLMSLGWALNANLRAKLRNTVRAQVGSPPTGDAAAGFIIDEANPRMLGGDPIAVTSQLDGNAGASPPVNGEAIYGAWNQLIVALWGEGFEVLVNPYESTAYSKGNVSVRGIADADVLVRHAQAFTHWHGIDLS